MGSVTVGYRYFVGMHLGICSGPVDALLEIRAGDRVAWNGQRYTTNTDGPFGITTYTPTGTPAPSTANERLVINAPELFGGDEKEGGLLGEMDVMFGRPDQGVNDYLAAQHGGITPSYRGLFSVVWRRGLVSSNNPYIKPWAFKVRRITQGWQGGVWYSAKAAIDLPNGAKAMNPAHIVYQCITDTDWGLGYGSSLIDDASFRAAADVFHAEGLGLCLKWTRQGTIESFVQIVMDHAGSILAQDRSTGLFKLLPLRGGYTVETLPLFDESNIVTLDSYQRPALPDAVNEISVKFEDVVTGQDGSVTVQNLANITAQGGVVTQPRNYPGLPTAELATRVAMRDLKAVSTALAKVRFRCNRAGASLLPGEVVRFSWAKLGIVSLVLRVVRVNTGTLTDGEVEIEAVEDVFALPATAYAAQQPTGWTEPASLPQAATDRVVREATFYEVRQELGADEAAALPVDAGFVVAAATVSAGDAQDFGLRTKPASSSTYDEADRAPICPSGSITAALSHTATTATLANMVDLELVTRVGYAQIGPEIVRVDSLNRATGVVTFARGVCGTVAAQHAEGAKLFFLDGFLAVDPTERVDGEVVNVKLTPRTGRGELTEASAPTDSITLDQVAARPYAPGRFRIGGQAYPELVDVVPALSWVHRDRLQQNLEGDDVTGSIGPEAGTTYTAEIRNGLTDAHISTQTGIASTTFTPTGLPAVPRLKVRLWAVRDGLASAQRHEWSFDYTAPTIAPGSTFTVQASMITGTSSGGFVGVGNALRGIVSFGGVLLASDRDAGMTNRLYTSTDGGQTWTVGYEGSAAVSFTPRTFDLVVGGNRIAYSINTTAGTRSALVATNNTTAPTITPEKPAVGAASVDVGAVYSDGTTAYIVGRLSSQLEAPGAFNLYSTTDGLALTLVGAMTQDPADPNATPGANSGFDSRLFVPSGLMSGDEFSRLKKFGSRWFLVGRQAIYYTDEAVPRTLWKRCPLGLNDGATSPTIAIEGLEKVGTKLVAWKANVPVGGDANPIAYSADDGLTWTTTRPVVLGSIDTLTREGYVFGGRLHIFTQSATGATRILHTADPAVSWSLQTSTPFDNYSQADYPMITASEVVLTSSIGNRRALVRSTDGITFSAVSGIAGNPTAIAPGRLFTPSAAILSGTAVGGGGGAGDSFGSNVVLLLHADGANGSTTFTDSSLYGQALTRTGDTQISTAQSQFGGSSLLFDGSGDRLTTAANSANTLDGDFTVEFWIRLAAYPASETYVLGWGGVQYFAINSSGVLQAVSGGSVSASASIPLNTWRHCAVVKSSGSTRIYVNGTGGSTSGSIGAFGSAGSSVTIGSFDSGGAASLNAHVDEVRITKGVARYTADFTPPTAAFPNPAGTSGVRLLLHLDGADGSTTITDSSFYARTLTRTGSTQISTAQSKFGGASCLFNGTTDLLSTGASADFAIGTSTDFTIELWLYVSALPGSIRYIYSWSSGAAWFGLNSAGTLTLQGSNPLTTSGTISAGAWNHIAVTRAGTTSRIFINGGLSASTTNLTINTSSTPTFRIAGSDAGAASFAGHIDEFRYIVGSAVYTDAFTPPTGPFPDPGAMPAPSLLLHLDGSNGSTTIGDSSGRHVFTASGNAQISTSQSKFGGASLLLDGVGDYVACTDNLADFRFGNGDFTVEAWVRTTDVDAAVVDFYATTGGGWQMFIGATGRLQWWRSGVSVAMHPAIVNDGQWHHLAVTRQGTTLRAFVDGVVDAGTENAFDYSAAAITTFAIGAQVFQRNAAYDFSGNIDEVRVIKGVAAYTSTFTPPTAPYGDPAL